MTEVTLQIESWDVSALIPYPLNSKVHDDAQVKKIVAAIKASGWDQPIVVDAEGVIIKGHGRRLAALEMGLTKVPVVCRRDLTPEQVRAARLADNRVAVSGIDADLLKQELADLDFDLTGIFDAKELKFLEADLGDINLDAFVPDINEAIAEQAVESAAAVKATDERPVKLDKAFGFKTITGGDERHVSRFMGLIEGQTGQTGAAALITFMKDFYARGGV